MSNIPKPAKIPKAKSITSTDHNSQEHENLLNETWGKLEQLIKKIYIVHEDILLSLKKQAVESYLASYQSRADELKKKLSRATPEQQVLINTTLSEINDYIENFKEPALDENKLAFELIGKKYQQEIWNDKNVTVGYVDIYAEISVVRNVQLEDHLLQTFPSFYLDDEEAFSYSEKDIDNHIKRMCDVNFKVPEWEISRSERGIYFDVRATIPTLAQLTRELQVIKSYIDSNTLVVVLNNVDNPLLIEVLSGHEILTIDLSKFTD